MGDTLHLCATARLAQTLRGVPAAGRAWRTPQALTVGQWFATLAEEAQLGGLAELPAALDPFAESLLWEQIVAASLADGAALFDISGMAAAAAEAHALTRIWNLRPAIGALSDEARLFTGWQAEFERRCRKAGWIDAAGLQRRLIELLAAGRFVLPARVEMHGFDRRTPLEDDLLAALTGRGVVVVAEPLAAVPGQAGRLSCADLAGECAAAVAWAQSRLAADPGCRLAIVAPDLAGVRDRLEFLLDDVLHPAAIRPDAAESSRCFNFSLGRPLAEQPLVRSALELLQLGGGRAKVEQARLSALLLAGGWSAAVAEADGRAQLDLALRRELPYFTSLPALLRLVKRPVGDGRAPCPCSVAALAALFEVLAGARRSQRPEQWSAVFRQALRAAGWPGDRQLSSHEFQARRAFDEVLDAFARLDPLLGSLNLAEAVHRLAQLCRQRLFQPETRGRPALQVLGMLESAGLEFDALWVMGMNDDLWPPPPRPNPLLPVELQRSAGTARASAEVELDFARRVHQRLLRSAPEVIFSYAGADGNRVLRPSPLLAGLPDLDLPPPDLITVASRLAAEAGSAGERIDDAIAPPVAAGEKVSGGSWLLRAQAICPAWAFYQFRLGAEAMETPVEGLDPAARGTLVHGALELFWRQTRDSAALAVLDAAALAERITAVVAEAVGRFEQERRVVLPARFRQLETVRLEKLLTVWLALEARRPAPFAVVACEQQVDVEIEGIRVRMVVDRIDQLVDGRQAIIDYKTGASIDIKNWAGQRITEPQLPIYAALVNDDVAAVVFAKVLGDKPAFAGIADECERLPGIQGIGDDKQKIFDPAVFPDWIAVITHWRERLHAIAGEVREGRAGVVFADEKGLQYCEVLPLLRLPERRRLLAEALGA
ncbi:PD-(D/E)XK nuclease family protein [Azonexus sp.]|jgi:exodeoxyribonuclease-5|uniref:PD-(D/E)XK nuclease family protein n=1 Tax=Azonexus sp. TaxID=1872668 RepID=UPI002835DDE7|nr:PD-(D/E)XK nuclease family protein [Azonexus sp.]MDR1994883.1 PD-(D/E)XK nuclease family protein [Azonexus sp.]